jgi:phage-related protein
MATGTRALTLKLLADVDNFTKNLDKADKDVMSFGDKVSDFGKKAGLAFAAAGAAAVAYAGKLAIDGVKSAIEDAAAQEKLALTLRNVTNATDKQIKATEDYITQTSLAFGITDDDLRPSLERLTRATGDVEKAQKLQTVAIDVAAGSGKSLEAVTNAMAKAAEGNTAALGKLGIGLTSAQLKTMSMDQITAKLADTFENQASTKADTFQGKLARLQVAFDEGKETVGSYILTAITPMVEVIVNRVIPAIADFTDNLGQKLRPVIEFLTPITNGLRSAFNSVKNSLSDNSEELKPLLTLFKAVAEFARDVLAPVLSKTLGAALSLIGKAISGLIDGLASVVTFFNNLYNSIKRVIDLSKQLGSNLNPFSNSSFSGATSPAAPTTPVTPSGIPSYLNVRPVSTTNITVNGAIDSESAARQIVQILNDSNARGTLGSAAFV